MPLPAPHPVLLHPAGPQLALLLDLLLLVAQAGVAAAPGKQQ
jgi:hypothetical protein